MRILHITAQKPDSTGSGVYLSQIVMACNRLGHEQSVVCGIDISDEVNLPEGVAVYPVLFNTPELPFNVCGMSDEMPYPSTRYRDLDDEKLARFESAFKDVIAKALVEFNPDVIVSNHLYLVTAFAKELLDELHLETPLLAICHNTCLRQLNQHDLANDRVIKAVRGLDKVLALHDEQKGRIVDLFSLDASDVEVIGTGYDKTIFYAPQKDPRLEDGARLNLIYVGKISRKKGIKSLFAALDLLPCAPGALHAYICGGVNNSFQKAALELLLQSSKHDVEYLGKLAPADLAEKYRESQVFVLPSFYEGLPLVVIEALACGCKVVVTDLPGLRPWIEQYIPNAPVWYVEPPRMQSVDEPLERDIPAFEQHLADAIKKAALAPALSVDTTSLSWDALGKRLVGLCAAELEHRK